MSRITGFTFTTLLAKMMNLMLMASIGFSLALSVVGLSTAASDKRFAATNETVFVLSTLAITYLLVWILGAVVLGALSASAIRKTDVADTQLAEITEIERGTEESLRVATESFVQEVARARDKDHG